MRAAWKRYRPEHSPAAQQVRPLHKVLIATPFLLMATISMNAQIAGEGFEFIALSPQENKKVSAYAPVVKASESIVKGDHAIDLKQARVVAYRWLEGAKVGLLQPLQPAAYEDTTRDGVKAEIVRSNLELAEALDDSAEREGFYHKYEHAAKDAMLSAAVLEICKFFDFSSLSMCSMVQRRCLHTVKSVFSKLDKPTRAQIVREALAMRANDDRLGQMAVRARQQLLQYELRRGLDYRKVATTEKQFDLREFRQPLPVVVKNLRDSGSLLHDPYTPDLYTDLRLGYDSAFQTDIRITDLSRQAPASL